MSRDWLQHMYARLTCGVRGRDSDREGQALQSACAANAMSSQNRSSLSLIGLRCFAITDFEFQCSYNTGQCGNVGDDRGQCICGRCVCNTEYSGTRCECPTSQLSCIATNGVG